MSKLSPMMAQYLAIKDEHPDKILFYQVGDFYELFFDDARIASRELDLVLTTRDGDKKDAIPLAGVPIHAVDGYLSRMLEKGYKVAICNQVEDASQSKGLVKREVARIVTPGTVIDENMLSETQNNYLASIIKDGENYYGLAITDISTGGLWAMEVSGENAEDVIRAEWQRINPTEVIISPWMAPEEILKAFGGNSLKTAIEVVPLRYFESASALKVLAEQWAEDKTDKEELARYPLAVSACGALISYLKSLQKSGLAHLKPVEFYFPSQYMVMDGITRRNLELTRTIREGKRKGSLLAVMDKTCSSMGSRLLKRWIEQPLKDIVKINKRIEAVAEFYDKPLLKDDLRNILGDIYDLERLCSRINYGTVNARDLVALKNTLALLPNIKELLLNSNAALLQEIAGAVPDFQWLTGEIGKAIIANPPLTVKEGGIINDGYNADVDRYREICREGKNWLLKHEKEERAKTGIKTLKIGYNRIYGYYIEITKNNLSMVPPDYHRKQTLVNAERFITEQLKKIEEEISGANDKLTGLEFMLFEELRQKVLAETSNIQEAAALLAQCDCLQGLAEVAIRNRYCKPQLGGERVFNVKDGRHPVIEQMDLAERFVPNDVFLDERQKILLITGPNMAGKSTYCRSVAIIALMAQIGSFVPAKEAKLPLLDRIFARVGASDDLSSGQSTFMVEMNETASILREATPETLVILDETGRGTSTYDGMSIARSVLEYIYRNLGSWTLFSTHYHELTVMEEEFPSIKNYTMAVREKGNTVIFLRKVVPGKADKSYGINVARLAGLPEEVISRAEVILSEAEKDNKDKKKAGRQISFFEVSDTVLESEEGYSALIDELKELKPELLSPLEALQELFRIREKLKR